MWSVPFAFRRKEKRTRFEDHAGFLPFAREHVGGFVRERMCVRGDGDARVKLSEHGHTAGRFVLVQDEQFDSGIRTWSPLLLTSDRDVLEHETIKRAAPPFASRRCNRVGRGD